MPSPRVQNMFVLKSSGGFSPLENRVLLRNAKALIAPDELVVTRLTVDDPTVESMCEHACHTHLGDI